MEKARNENKTKKTYNVILIDSILLKRKRSSKQVDEENASGNER